MKYKPLYIAATGQHIGKTTVALGLVRHLCDQGILCGFMKPVGQSYVIIDGEKVDEDAVLIRDTFRLTDALKDMSPIAVEQGFTEKHIFARDSHILRRLVQDSYARLIRDKEAMVIEGTGHAGVGSCFGLSNADVAQALGCVAIIVSGGGIGRPIDEIALSASLFGCRGVPTLGAVLNKVLGEKYEKIRRVAATGLSNMGMALLGAAPYLDQLTYPTLQQLVQHLNLDVLSPGDGLAVRAEHNIVGAMKPEHMAPYLRDHTLVILPGDRLDNIEVCIAEQIKPGPPQLAGVILTGGLVPPEPVLERLRAAHLPVLLSRDDTYTVSTDIRELVFKIESSDTDKIAAAQQMVCTNVDVARVLTAIQIHARGRVAVGPA